MSNRHVRIREFAAPRAPGIVTELVVGRLGAVDGARLFGGPILVHA